MWEVKWKVGTTVCTVQVEQLNSNDPPDIATTLVVDFDSASFLDWLETIFLVYTQSLTGKVICDKLIPDIPVKILQLS